MLNLRIKYSSRNARNARGVLFKYIHDGITRLWKDSIKAFLNETMKHVNVDTGMSRASLVPLAAELRMKTVVLESLKGRGPIGARLSGIKDPRFADNNNLVRSPGAGMRLGRKAYHINFPNRGKSPQWRFTFKIVVFQWYLHELGLAPGTGPWNAIEKGRDAMVEYFNGEAHRYVDPKKILIGLQATEVNYAG